MAVEEHDLHRPEDRRLKSIMVLDQITPLILTLNEAPNIGRSLERLSWARDTVVVDSFSDDDTVAIAKSRPNVRVFERKFDNHAAQWNFALHETGIASEWVLALDCDYMVPDGLIREIRALSPDPDVAAYRASFRYCIQGRPLRGTVYPPVAVLYRRAGARYVQDGHTQRVQLVGRILDLESRIDHDDRKPLHHWLSAQARYMRLEAEKLRHERYSESSLQDRIRRLIVVAPAAVFVYCLFVKGNVLDGRAGLFYAMQRSLAEGILSLYLLESLTRGTPSK